MAEPTPIPIVLDRKQLLGFDPITQAHDERNLASPKASGKRSPNWAKVGVKPGSDSGRVDSKA